MSRCASSTLTKVEAGTASSSNVPNDVAYVPKQVPLDSPNIDPPFFNDASKGDDASKVYLRQRSRSHSTIPASRSERYLKDNLGGVIGPGVYIKNSPAGVEKYYQERMAELKRMRPWGVLPPVIRSTATARDSYTRTQVLSLGKPAGITKPKPPPSELAVQSVVAGPESSCAIETAIPRHIPMVMILEDFSKKGHLRKALKHKRAAASKKVDGWENKHWRELPDYTPPLSSLVSPLCLTPDSLKAHWRGKARDLSRDDDVDALGLEEYALVSQLRLLPQQYLANKRRIFESHFKHLQQGKKFTKTAAQMVCNIDVNKASYLWEAFSQVGWFNQSWFEGCLTDLSQYSESRHTYEWDA